MYNDVNTDTEGVSEADTDTECRSVGAPEDASPPPPTSITRALSIIPAASSTSTAPRARTAYLPDNDPFAGRPVASTQAHLKLLASRGFDLNDPNTLHLARFLASNDKSCIERQAARDRAALKNKNSEPVNVAATKVHLNCLELAGHSPHDPDTQEQALRLAASEIPIVARRLVFPSASPPPVAALAAAAPSRTPPPTRFTDVSWAKAFTLLAADMPGSNGNTQNTHAHSSLNAPCMTFAKIQTDSHILFICLLHCCV